MKVIKVKKEAVTRAERHGMAYHHKSCITINTYHISLYPHFMLLGTLMKGIKFVWPLHSTACCFVVFSYIFSSLVIITAREFSVYVNERYLRFIIVQKVQRTAAYRINNKIK